MSKVLGTVVLRESMGRVITAVQLCEHAYIPKCLHKRHIIIQTTSFKKAQAASVSVTSHRKNSQRINCQLTQNLLFGYY